MLRAQSLMTFLLQKYNYYVYCPIQFTPRLVLDDYFH